LNKRIANIAMDASINQFIQNLPKGGVQVSELNKAYNLNMELEQTWEYYYSCLLKKAEELTSDGQNSMDEHEVDAGEASGMNPSEIKASIKQTMDQAIKASKGNVPSNVLKIFDNLNSQCQLPWQQLLSNFVARSISTTTKNTRKKINRRFGLEQPGKKKKRELTLGVCVDSSGSVSDEAFQSFLTEVSRISQICQTTYLVDADCVVQNVDVIKKGKKVKNQRSGSGGTAYQPAIDKCLELKCDAIIYFGDADSADTPKNPKIPFLWVIVGNQNPPGNFGSVVRL
jgi:predicted metal-dependent peptidase